MDVPKSTARLRRLEPLVADLPLGTDPLAVRRRVEALERLLEGMIEIPVLRRKVGLDAIAGVIPVAGDLVTAAMGLYLVWEARNLDMPRWQLWRMIANVGIDTAVGAVPIAGDLFDLLYRSNTRNLRIIRKHLDRHHPATRIIES
ncbi:MAG: DUF4112 domain-containing protein [Pseudomonadota bacterium]